MESEGLLPHLQVPATRPYPEPARFSTHPQFLKIHFNFILPLCIYVYIYTTVCVCARVCECV